MTELKKRGERTIEGVPTSIAAFIGRSQRAPVNEPLVIRGPADFDRLNLSA